MKQNKLYVFLKTIGVYEQYVDCINNHIVTNWYIYKRIHNVREIFKEDNIDKRSMQFLFWAKTPQGFDFWKNIERLWILFLIKSCK